jgi:hypothetical protein
VLYTTKPAAGDIIACICAVVIRGGNNPLALDFTSSIAELSGALLSLLIPTWANNVALQSRRTQTKTVIVFMIVRL